MSNDKRNKDRSDQWDKSLSMLDEDEAPAPDSGGEPEDALLPNEPAEGAGQTRFNVYIDNPIGRRFRALGKMSGKESINSLAQEAFKRYLDNLPDDKLRALDMFDKFNS